MGVVLAYFLSSRGIRFALQCFQSENCLVSLHEEGSNHAQDVVSSTMQRLFAGSG